MIRRPPRSTLFPYTTSSDLRRGRPGGLPAAAAAAARDCQRLARSEEHTSELQSRRDLVCRLLLEKKITIPLQVADHSRWRRRDVGWTLLPASLTQGLGLSTKLSSSFFLNDPATPEFYPFPYTTLFR